MKEYQVDFVETVESTVIVVADDEHEAYKLAERELDKNFVAPYHTNCDLEDFTVTLLHDYDEDDEDEAE